MTSTGELYRLVTEITEEYLGPAAERFVSRQISFHLNKDPHEITHEDLSKLIEWTKITFGLITEDQKIVNEYVNKLTRLSER